MKKFRWKIGRTKIIAMITIVTKGGTKITISAMDIIALAFVFFFLASFVLTLLGLMEEKWLYFWAGASVPALLKFFLREKDG